MSPIIIMIVIETGILRLHGKRGTTTQIKRIFFQCYKLITYVGWNFNSGNYLFTTDTK